VKSCSIIEHIPAAELRPRNQGSDDDRYEYVVMAFLYLHFQCLLPLKREDGSCGLDEDKDVKQDRRRYCKAGTPGDYSWVTSSFWFSKFLSAQTEFNGLTFSFM